jgi:hypothetical protein
MYQPYPSSCQPAEPERSAAPAPVRTAVKLMYAGAAVSAVPLLITLASIGDTSSYHLRWNDHNLTAAQISHLRPLLITVGILVGLIVPAVWLWMARANKRGRNWARIVSTVLFCWATLQLLGAFTALPVIHARPGVEVPSLLGGMLAWLLGGAAVWLLWRPDSSAFFKARDFVHVPPARPMPPGQFPRSL